MNKNIRYLFLLLALSFFTGCSFGDRTGIWSGGEDEKRRVAELQKKQKSTIEIIKIFSSKSEFSKEISVNQKIILSKPKKNMSWQMSNLNLQNSVRNIYLSSIENNFLKKKIGKDKFKISKIKSTPLVFNNNIIFTDDTGTIFSINKSGKINWKKNIYKKIYKKIYKSLTFSIYKNNIYVADNIGFVYSVNIGNGKINWIKNHGIPLKSNVKVFEEKVFVINQDNRLLSFDSKSGSKIWDVRSITSFIKSQNVLGLAISKDGDVIMLSSSGDLLRVNSRKGRMYWSSNTTGTMSVNDSVFFKSSDLAISGNDIIFSSLSSIFSININNGYLNWKNNMSTNGTPIIDGKYIFLVTENGYFVCLDKFTGKIIFSQNIIKILKKKKQDTEISGFIMGSGNIYATTFNGYLIVCSASTGKPEYYKKIGDSISASPIISDGSLYVLTEKSRILGFN